MKNKSRYKIRFLIYDLRIVDKNFSEFNRTYNSSIKNDSWVRYNFLGECVSDFKEWIG
jgi:hypothetical protein